MKIVQVTLRSDREQLTTWVDYRPELKAGMWITLKDFKPEQKWWIVAVYKGIHEASDFEWHRKWTNNI